MNLTIASVSDQVKPWTSQQGGPMVSIYLTFEGGKRGTVNAKADNKDKRIAEMKALIGQAGEFEVDEGDGKFPMKVKSWPGKVAFGSGPGGGGSKWQPKSIEERNEIIAQSCLNAAVAVAAADKIINAGTIMDFQNMFFANTIRLARGSEVAAGVTGSPGSPQPPQAASEHRSAPGEGPVGEGGQPTPGADTTSVVPPAPGSVGGASGGPPPGAEAEGATDTGQAATDDPLIDTKQNATLHAIAGEFGWDHDEMKRHLSKKDPDSWHVNELTWAEAQKCIQFLRDKLDRERGLA